MSKERWILSFELFIPEGFDPDKQSAMHLSESVRTAMHLPELCIQNVALERKHA